jgi:hypothetical protein
MNTSVDANDKNFTIWSSIKPLKVRVITPNGGENFVVNTVNKIEWNIEFGNPPYTSKIEYSTSGLNGPWFPIVNETTQTFHKWTVPSVVSTKCYIRVIVSDSSYPVPKRSIDISDKNFTISQVSIIVISPNGLENLYVNKLCRIKWQTLGSIEYVNVEYSITGMNGPYESIVVRLKNTGSYRWVVPNTPSTDCYVRIVATHNTTIADTSDRNFTISVPLCTVTGRVLDENNEPMVNITIKLGNYSTTTDSEGRFRILVYPGSYVLNISLEGYEPYNTNLTIGIEQLQVDIGDIKLIPIRKSGFPVGLVVGAIVGAVVIFLLLFLFILPKIRKKDVERQPTVMKPTKPLFPEQPPPPPPPAHLVEDVKIYQPYKQEKTEYLRTYPPQPQKVQDTVFRPTIIGNRCSRCGKLNDPDDTICFWCGVPLSRIPG